jgi:hypothetical protein
VLIALVLFGLWCVAPAACVESLKDLLAAVVFAVGHWDLWFLMIHLPVCSKPGTYAPDAKMATCKLCPKGFQCPTNAMR